VVLSHGTGVRFPVPLPIVALIAAALVVSPGASQAHHSISGVYDSSRRVTLEGVVAQFQLVNPHPFLVIDVMGQAQPGGDAGKPQSWRLEMDNLWELAAIGITASTIRPGDRVRVSGSLARAQDQRLYLLRLDRPADGFWYEQVGQSPKIGSPAR
jgi:hypothetical protein